MKSYHKEILRIALPSILSNITVPLLGLADMTIVGHLGSAAYIGAIAIGGTVFNMIYWIFAFLRMGTSGMTSQAYGARRNREMQNLLYRSLTASAGVALALMLLQIPVLNVALLIMQPTPAVASLASAYFGICIWGAPAVLGLYSLTGWFLGLQNARNPLYVAVFQNIVNICASLFFVFVLHAGVEGVAAGTLIAQYCGLLLSLFYCRRMHRRLGLGFTFSIREVMDRAALRRFFTVNRDIFLRTLCLVSVTLYFTSAGSRQGETILAVNALLMQYFTLYSYFMDGFAFAGEALAGKCFGAGDREGLRNIIRNLFLWGGGVALCFTLLYAVGGSAFMRLLTNEGEVIAAASAYLPWVAAIPFTGLSAFTWDGIFIGLTATRYMLISMFCATATFFLTYFCLEPVWLNHALWLAFLLYLFMRGCVQHLLYKKKILSLHP